MQLTSQPHLTVEVVIIMDEKPSIVVVSCSNVEPETIINLLSTCTKINKSEESSSLYSWTIDTKYYTADVNIRTIKPDVNNEELEDCVEAIVIHFDSNRETGLDDLTKWKSFVENHQPDIKILIADALNTDTKISKRKAIGWCLENGFELIELNPGQTEDDSSSEEEIIKETKGVERVIEALQTHMWSNLVMKSKVNQYSSNCDSESPNLAGNSSVDTMLDNLMLDDEQLEFDELFQRLHMVKESVQSLSVRERRHCAEQVVAAFWRALGGDEDEIENI